MTDNIIKLVDKKDNEPDEAIVDMLHNLLAEAEAGRLIGLGCVLVVNEHGDTGNCFVAQNVAGMIGQCEILKRELIDAHIALRHHEEGEVY